MEILNTVTHNYNTIKWPDYDRRLLEAHSMEMEQNKCKFQNGYRYRFSNICC